MRTTYLQNTVIRMLHLFCQTCNSIVEAVPVENPTDSVAGCCPVCGTGLPAHRYIAPGTVINGFRVEREIGRGGMGVVYLAKQLDLDRDIALKVLSDEMASDSVFVEAFFREARAAAALNHPNIVQAIDAGTAENGIYYFVMELIAGENLELYTRRQGALDYNLAFKCATRIADALTFAWESKKLAHRDIKPENIILTEQNEFKLADLGLAKDYHDNSVENEDDLMATPAYASPEVIRGEMDKIGFKSDMYSFGATLYQLFTGHPPFEGNDPAVLCQKQLDEQPKPLIAIKPELPSRLSILIDRLMEKNPERRPEQWSDVLQELNEIAVEWLRRQARKNNNADSQADLEWLEETGMNSGTKLRLAIVAGLIVLALILVGAIIHVKAAREQAAHSKKREVKVIQTVVVSKPEEENPPETTETEEETTTAETVDQPPAQTAPQATPAPVVMELSAFELLKKNLARDPYRRWCEVNRFVEGRGSDATQEEKDFLTDLTNRYMTPFGSKLLEDMDKLHTKARLLIQNDPDKLKELLDEINAVLKRANTYQQWTNEICSNGEYERFEKLKKQIFNRYIVMKRREEMQESAIRRKNAAFLQICNDLYKLSGDEIIEKVDLWAKRHARVLSEQDRSNTFRLKNLAAAKKLTLHEFLKNKTAAFYKQEIFPEIYPGMRFLRFSSNGKAMIFLNKNSYEVRRRVEILTEQEAKCLLDLLMHPEALENLSITEKKMLINRAFFLKLPSAKFREKLCKNPDDEKILFQDVNALPSYTFPQ